MSDDQIRILPCPWCGSEYIFAEGTVKRMAMVCQKCLARGPEIRVEAGRDAAVREWNGRVPLPQYQTLARRWICKTCGNTVAQATYGSGGPNPRTAWKHVGGKRSTPCCRLPIPIPRVEGKETKV
jgi:hypothetical protein